MRTRIIAVVVATTAVALGSAACASDPNEPPTPEHASALASAQNHLRSESFSEVGLRRTLITYEGYQPEVAGWAIAHSGYTEKEWVSEAKEAVGLYQYHALQLGLPGDSYPTDQLEDLLIRDGFTKEQADRAVGYI